MLRRVGGSAVVLACLLGCASGKSAPSAASPVPQSAAPTIESIAGTYGLVAIDGHPLPFARRTRGQAANATAWAVVSGTLALKADGTFRIETSYDTRASSEQTAFAFSGTCYAEGTEVRMAWDGGGSNLTSRGDTLLMKNEGTLFSYLRR